ncbi:MAG: alpha/beta hydrolase [Brevefilum sp.]
MVEKNQTHKTQIQGWTFRIKDPPSKTTSAPILLLLHGHLGNEDVMWILTNSLPKGYTMLSPRAPVETGDNQFSWHKIGPQWPEIDLYRELTEKLLIRVDQWAKDNAPKVSRYDVMGFSQGAVLAYALAILHPERIHRTAAIAGFIPQSWKPELTENALKDKSFFIAHGTEDNTVPVKKAQKASKWLKEQGADVTFCTAETGHKISADCFNGLGDFFQMDQTSAAADQGNHT